MRPYFSVIYIYICCINLFCVCKNFVISIYIYIYIFKAMFNFYPSIKIFVMTSFDDAYSNWSNHLLTIKLFFLYVPLTDCSWQGIETFSGETFETFSELKLFLNLFGFVGDITSQRGQLTFELIDRCKASPLSFQGYEAKLSEQDFRFPFKLKRIWSD